MNLAFLAHRCLLESTSVQGNIQRTNGAPLTFAAKSFVNVLFAVMVQGNHVRKVHHQWVECARWYFSPFKFLYRFPQISHLYGLSFSMPMPSGYGVFDRGSMIEIVPSSFW